MFTDLFHRSAPGAAWTKIPWHDPDFSRRMLAEHLDQSHDLASRRFALIDQHVQWIHRKILGQAPSHILDIGCGPGFYTQRFVELGHTCRGIDFSPASIAYAREHDAATGYVLGDVRDVDFGSGYDLVTLIYGELNAFSPQDAAHIIAKAHDALKPGGVLLLEVHRAAFIYQIGQAAPSWHTAQRGLFADEPYLCLVESSYDLGRAITDHYVFLAESGEMQRYTSMHYGYTDDEYRRLLGTFAAVLFYPSLDGGADPADLFVIAAKK